MKDLLGDDMFRKCLHAYMDRWHGKHPNPWDFFNTYSDVAGRNLNWFWSSWYFSNNYIDMKITAVNKSGKSYAVNIENVGGFPAPFDLMIKYADGTTDSLHQTPGLWEKNMKTATVQIDTKKVISSVTIDGGIFMDADRADNTWDVK